MPFTPLPTALGAILLHLSTSNLLLNNGRILGVSSILGNTLLPPLPTSSAATTSSYLATVKQNLPILLGMAAGSVGAYIAAPELFAYLKVLEGGGMDVDLPGLGRWTAAVAGGLVGFGTFFSCGCTSGHMLCGLPRLSLRSLLSTATFTLTAILTASLLPIPTSLTPTCTSGSFLSCFTPSPSPPTSTTLTHVLLILLALLGNHTIATRLPPTPASRAISAFWSGAVFALGLVVSGMTDPAKVVGFLRVGEGLLGDGRRLGWRYFDPSLLLVIGGGVVPNLVRWQLAGVGGKGGEKEAKAKGDSSTKKGALKPALDTTYHLPTKSAIDPGLILGSVIFGAGWGLMGVCPGPGVVSAVVGGWSGVALRQVSGYLVGFLAGRGLAKVLDGCTSRISLRGRSGGNRPHVHVDETAPLLAAGEV